VAGAFITGISGFAGSHLAELCLAESMAVSGLARDPAAAPNLAGVKGSISLHQGDLGDCRRLAEVLDEARPDLIFHLAAETGGGAPEDRLLETNVIGTLNLLAAAALLSPVPRLLVASSSAVYGRGPVPGAPIGETSDLDPLSPYGLSKAAQERLALWLAAVLGVPVIVARAFNQTGPRESDAFVAASIARQIAEIEAGAAPPRIAVGRRDTSRDFTDVRDIARGYLLAATRGKPGEAYNLASGTAVSIQELVDRLVRLSGRPIEIVEDPARMRPAELLSQVGDATKARSELGWEPRISLDRTLRDLLDHMRAAISRK
jgi:GDP-4-dehydro-6-deoxy-D-mannose reductase